LTDAATRAALLQTIDNGRAHIAFDQLVNHFPAEDYNRRAANVPYSFWGLLEHVRICLHLSRDYAIGEEFTPLSWPADFWPNAEAIATEADWLTTVSSIRAGIDELKRIAADDSIDLGQRCRHAPADSESTILFELIDAIDHLAYHVGEFAILRQIHANWPPDHQV
jgi:hypothetical protein